MVFYLVQVLLSGWSACGGQEDDFYYFIGPSNVKLESSKIIFPSSWCIIKLYVFFLGYNKWEQLWMKLWLDWYEVNNHIYLSVISNQLPLLPFEHSGSYISRMK